MFFCVRFSRGKVVEVNERQIPFDFDGQMAWESQNDWRQVPLTVEKPDSSES